MNESKKAASSGGITFCGLLTVAFIVLKLIGAIKWGWGWVLSPLWMPVAITIGIIVISLIIGIIKGVIKGTAEVKRRRNDSE